MGRLQPSLIRATSTETHFANRRSGFLFIFLQRAVQQARQFWSVGGQLASNPGVLFMGALVVRALQPPQNEPAHTAQQIVMWYAVRMWTLWLLLIALPFAVLVTGCVTLARNWRDDMKLSQAAQQMLAAIHADRAILFVAATTLTAGAILAIVVLHMAAN
jgi:hypothetical protein